MNDNNEYFQTVLKDRIAKINSMISTIGELIDSSVDNDIDSKIKIAFDSIQCELNSQYQKLKIKNISNNTKKKNNIFFNLTDTSEQYTELYLFNLISKILSENGMVDFEILYNKISEKYLGIKINKNALMGFVANKFHLGLGTKKKVFFNKQDIDEKHTEKYLINLIQDILPQKPRTKNELIWRISNFYNNEKINHSAFGKLLDERFICKGLYYYPKPKWLSDETSEESNFKMLYTNKKNYDTKYSFQRNSYIKILQDNIERPLNELLKEYNEKLENPNSNLINVVMLSLSTEIKQDLLNIEKCIDICININNNSDYYLDKIQKATSAINDRNFNIQFSFFLKNTSVIKFFTAYGILYVQDLLNISPQKILILSAVDLDETIKKIELLSNDYYITTSHKINITVNNAINERTYKILLSRNGFFINNGKTLEAIGEEYGLSRERIRQIEAKAIKNLTFYAEAIDDNLIQFFNILIKTHNVTYMYVQDILQKYNDKETIYNACLLLLVLNIKYKYDEKYHIIYDSETISIQNIENRIIKKFGQLFNISYYNSASSLEKEIIDNNYVLSGRQKILYRYKQYSQTAFLVDLIDELFPDGYRLYNNDEYNILQEEYKNRLGDEIEVPSMTAVRGLIDRDMFCQIGKGIYKLRKKCVDIPQKLLISIFDFIVDNLPMIDYITIYNHFENELKNIGIDNYYYMKGIIDYSLPDDLLTKRNYITDANNTISAVEARLNYIRSLNGMFSLDDLLEKYPGVKPYVFYFTLYDEEKNGLIQIGNKKFIYFNKLNISNEIILKIKNIIDELFKYTNSNILSSRKIYAKIKISYPEILKELTFIEGHFSMFSLIQYIFSNDYYFDRPYIAKEKTSAHGLTTRSVIISYLSNQEIIDFELYQKYCMKMNINMVYTYMQLVDELSDNFVQLDDRQMIRKDILDIPEKSLQKIEQTLEIVLSRQCKLETSKFKGYVMFPMIKYDWNKHVLAGIVRSYFSDKYEVKNLTQGSKSEAIDYEIRRF